MGNEIEIVSDDTGIAVLGSAEDVDRFFLTSGLDRTPSKKLDLHRLWSLSGTGGAAAQVGDELAANSGRWVKLTAESAAAVKKYGLMSTKTPGVSHAVIGDPGNIRQWLQIAQAPTALLSGPLALTALSTMMQQRAMQQQMDEIADYLQTIDEKVDDILRGQKDAVLADMIGVDLIVEEALTVRDQVGRVSEVTWSKVQATGMTIARTQAYAIRELDALADNLETKADLSEIAKATRDAAPKVQEWLAVLARTVQLQDGISVLELDRVFDGHPDELDSHRRGLSNARENRLQLIGRITSRLLTRMEETVRKANAAVLVNPFDSPAAVRSSNRVATDILDFRGWLGIESGHESEEARRWRQAASEVRDKVLLSARGAAGTAGRLGTDRLDRVTERFRAVDLDGDGIPDKPRAAAAAEQAGDAIKGAAAGIGGAFGTFLRKKNKTIADSTPADGPSASNKP